MASLAQLETWLEEAETARHNLAMGEQVVEIWRDGRRVSYSQTNLRALTDYVAWLHAEIGKVTAAAAGRPRRSAIGTVWKD
jgi:hypothetical protein